MTEITKRRVTMSFTTTKKIEDIVALLQLLDDAEDIEIKAGAVKPEPEPMAGRKGGLKGGRKQDPRLIYERAVNGQGKEFQRLNVAASLGKLGLSREELLRGVWRLGTAECKVKAAIVHGKAYQRASEPKISEPRTSETANGRAH